MEFGILGPLRAVGPDGPIELMAAKQRALLATLLLARHGEAVSATYLIDVLWGDDPPATAAKALQVHVSQLRRALGPDQPIVTRAAGYAADLGPEALDLDRFESLVERAHEERAAARLAETSRLLREALGLFRGPPLVDAPLMGPAAAEPGRLASLRLAVLEERIEVDLETGGHATVIGELEALTAEHPYRERMVAQLMLALYRSGRQADALEAFRRARRALVEDLGLDPRRELQALEAAVLAQDPALDLPAAPASQATPEPARPLLPVPLTPLLGREADVETAVALLAEPGVRLLTLTGPGGIGKTRLGLELARRLAPRFEDGARFVPLGAIAEPGRVVPAVAQALGAVEGEGQSPFDALAAHLAGRSVLVVLDNFEQVLDAAPDVARLLAASPRVKLVVTSRSPLRVAGEQELAISPLARAPAVELFVSRARALNPRHVLATGDEEQIERICEALDGLPLAIELAAARSKLLAPAAILERLARRLDLLSAGPRDAPERQQTLRAAIGWSYDLLDPEVRAVFARLGVFAGGWTLEAAEAVCGPDALEALATLMDQSLVTAAGGRFEMLETVRDYALERLAETGTEPAVRGRHAEAYAELAESADRGLQSRDIGAWLDRVHDDRENIRAAVAFAVAQRDAATALRLCGAWRYWFTRGNLTDGRALVTAALSSGEGPPEVRLQALNAAGVLASEQGDFAAARELFDESLALARAVDAPAWVARAFSNLGALAMYDDDFVEALRLYEQPLRYYREAGDVRSLSLATQNLGLAHSGAGEHERAIELLAESVVLARDAGDPAHLSSTMRSLARAQLLGASESSPALELLKESLVLSGDLGDRPGILECLETLAAVAGRDGHPHEGALLIGAAASARVAAGATRQPDEDAWVREVEIELREVLGAGAFVAAVRDGERLELREAVARALAI
jgi:predicted ATPase/DNA-binding SARP family transcriptional activator